MPQHPSPSGLGCPGFVQLHLPLLCGCHGVGLGSIEVVVPRDGADGHSGRSCGGDVESPALGGMCLAGCGRGALHSWKIVSSQHFSVVCTDANLKEIRRLWIREAFGVSVIGVNGSIDSYLRKVEGAISCSGDGARRAQAGPSKHLVCASCYSAFGGCREEVCRGGCGSQCLAIEVRDAEVGNVGESFPGSAANSDFLVLPRGLPIKALQLLEE